MDDDVTQINGEQTIVKRSKELPLIKFYCSWFCPYAQRVWITLEEKRLFYQYVEINPYQVTNGSDGNTKISLSLDDKRLKYPEFVRCSPKGLIPALYHHGDEICESMVCMEYLDEFYLQDPILPRKNPGLKAKLRYWCIYINEKIIPHYYKMLMKETDSEREQAKQDILSALKQFAIEMAPMTVGPFFLGSDFSMVDITLAPWFQRLLTVANYYRGFQIPSSDNTTDATMDQKLYTRLQEWFQAVSHRPSFAKTVVDPDRLIKNYSGYASNTATSDAAKKFR